MLFLRQQQVEKVTKDNYGKLSDVDSRRSTPQECVERNEKFENLKNVFECAKK